MLILLHLVQHKYVKILYKNFVPQAVIYRKTFMCLCRKIINPIYTIYNDFHALYINFKVFEYNSQELKLAQIDR